MGEEHFKREQQQGKAIGKFYQEHPGWHLSEVPKCPTAAAASFSTAKGTGMLTENGGLTLA